MGFKQREIRMWSREFTLPSFVYEIGKLTRLVRFVSAQGLLRHEAIIREEATRTRTRRQRQSERGRRRWRDLCRPRRRRSYKPRSLILRPQTRCLKKSFHRHSLCRSIYIFLIAVPFVFSSPRYPPILSLEFVTIDSFAFSIDCSKFVSYHCWNLSLCKNLHVFSYSLLSLTLLSMSVLEKD